MKKIIIIMLFLVAISFGRNWYNWQDYFRVNIYSEIDSLYVPNGLVCPRIYDIDNLEADSIDVEKVIADYGDIATLDSDSLIAVLLFGTTLDFDNANVDSFVTPADVIPDSSVNYGDGVKDYVQATDFDSLRATNVAIDTVTSQTVFSDTITAAYILGTCDSADVAAVADVAVYSYMLGSTNSTTYAYNVFGEIIWTGNTDRFTISDGNVGAYTSFFMYISKKSATPEDYTVSFQYVQDTLIIIMDAADTANATGDTLLYWFAGESL